MEPAIHYDAVVRANPMFWEPIFKALKGDYTLFDRLLGMAKQDFPAMYQALVSAHRYALCGQQAFVVGPRMQKMLLDTDCTAVPRQFLRLPFDGFYIATPDSELELFGDRRTGMHRLGGMYVSKDTDHSFVVVLWGVPNKQSINDFDDATFWFRIDLNKAQRTEVNGVELVDVEGHIREMLADPSTARNDALVDIRPEDHEKTIRNVPDATRLVVNLLLYLASGGEREVQDNRQTARDFESQTTAKLGRTKSSRKAGKLLRRAQKQSAQMTAAVITWLGKSVESTPAETPSGNSGGWSVRRGHFHHFWTGKRVLEDGSRQKGEKLVLKWVLPVYRKPIGAEAPRHEYRFEADKTGGPYGPEYGA